MKTNIKEIAEKLNDLSFDQNRYEILENIPEETIEEYFGDYEIVDSDLYVDKHRWYETSITVFKIDDGYLGCESVTDLFSESMDWSDCGHTLHFFEMEQINIVSYKIKK